MSCCNNSSLSTTKPWIYRRLLRQALRKKPKGPVLNTVNWNGSTSLSKLRIFTAVRCFLSAASLAMLCASDGARFSALRPVSCGKALSLSSASCTWATVDCSGSATCSLRRSRYKADLVPESFGCGIACWAGVCGASAPGVAGLSWRRAKSLAAPWGTDVEAIGAGAAAGSAACCCRLRRSVVGAPARRSSSMRLRKARRLASSLLPKPKRSALADNSASSRSGSTGEFKLPSGLI